jgi:RimJ/RimL family protein N-acetyltransferase
MEIYLETERLLLRPFTVDDVDNLVLLDGDPEVMRYLSGGAPTPRDVIERETLPRFFSYYERGERYGVWAAIEKTTGTFLGRFIFRPLQDTDPDEFDLGFRLRRSAWGKGYGTEGSLALIRKGFTELGVRRVTASAVEANVASNRVLEKVGLTRVGTYRSAHPERFGGEESEVVVYALTKEAWERAQR